MTLFTQGTRSYLLVSTVFGAVVALGDWIALTIIGVPAAALWGLLAFVTNYVPNIGFVLGVVPPALLGLLAGGWSELVAIVVVYSLLNFVVQTLVQPRFVGDSVGLSMTVTFIALLFWSWVLGAPRRAAGHPADAPGEGAARGRRPEGPLAGHPHARGAAGASDDARAAGCTPAGPRSRPCGGSISSPRRVPHRSDDDQSVPSTSGPSSQVSRRVPESRPGVARCRSCAAGAAARPAEEAAMKGDRIEIVIDAGGTTRTYDIEATRAGRRSR